MRRSPVHVLAALGAAALLLTGCSGGGADAETASAGGGGGSDQGASSEDGGAAGAPSAADAGTAPGPTSLAGQPLISGRVAPGAALIRTAELSVRVDDVREAADRAAQLTTSAGGVVASEERSSAGEDGSALLVLRVPPKAYDATLARLAELGEELDRRRGTTDVTEQVVDLDSRTATQRASVERVRALLDRADTIGEIVQVEAELTRRTADLESLEARLSALEGQVDLATITLRLSGGDGPLLAGGTPRGFSDGLAAGWSALVAVGRAVGVTAGALLPFAPLLLLVGLLWRWHARRSAGPAPVAGS